MRCTPWPRWLWMPWGASFVLVTGACGGGAGGWGGVITDSAGVTVVANPEAGRWRTGEGWDVREELTIGRVDGDPGYLFGSIAGVCVGSTGEVIVVDRQAATARVFDREGLLVRTLGGPGSGPGELSNTLAGCWVGPGDTLAVPDLQRFRINRYTLDGMEVASVPFDAGGIPIRWEVFPDGRLVAQMRFGLFDVAQLGFPDLLVAESPGGTLGDTVLALPPSAAAPRLSGQLRYTLLAPQPIWTLDHNGGVWVYDGGDYRLVRYDTAGSPATVVTRQLDPRAVNEIDRALIADRIEATFPGPFITNVLKGINFAPTFPFVFALSTGPDGTLWAQRYRAPSSMAAGARAEADFGPQDVEVFLADVALRLGAPEWDVFDAVGRYLGAVTLPEGFEAFAFVGDAIYGVWRDSMGVEYVKRLRIVRHR